MRIIAGTLGGRIFESPRAAVTHPMADKVRGGLFNALGDITGLTVLDAFAGSGALSFEALSRGARSAVAIDNDKSAQRTIAENARSLGVTRKLKLISATASSWLNTSKETEKFNLVFCDPPYQDLQLPLINRLVARMMSDGLLVLSWPGDQPAPELDGLQIVKQKSYGDAQLIFYRCPE